MKILVAEDNLFYRRALEATLQSWGYEVEAVANGLDALAALTRADGPRLAILDWMMPGMDGPDVCRRVRTHSFVEAPYILILTAKDGKSNIVAALESGADDYLTKPFDRLELQARIQVGKRIVGLQTSQTVVFAFARAVEAKSSYTQGHADRVTNYALALADAVGVSGDQRSILHKGALLHDIGKISVPEAILNKNGKLTNEEFDLMKQHPAQGAAIVQPLTSLADTLPLIRWHHERPDGQGYPDGLAGDQIPLLVRILSVADVYDALASDRPYRPAMTHEEALAILRSSAASGGLDPDLVESFCRLEPVFVKKSGQKHSRPGIPLAELRKMMSLPQEFAATP